MTDAEIIRACAARFTVWHAPAHVIVNDLLRIADRLERIDSPMVVQMREKADEYTRLAERAKTEGQRGLPWRKP